MDTPQHQVFGTDSQSYRYMSYPPQKQKLQLLYPGRFMDQSYHYTGENIPNEDPDGVALTQAQTAMLARAASADEEAFSRHLGGKDKVVYHPAVEPEALTEDPALKDITVYTDPGVDANLDRERSPLDNLYFTEKRDREIAREVRASLLRTPSQETKYPPYDWTISPENAYMLDENTTTENFSHGRNRKGTPKSRAMWFTVILFIVLSTLVICGSVISL